MKLLPLLTLTTLVLAAPSLAATIYGAADNNTLYTINPLTGVSTTIGTLQTAGNTPVTMFDIAEFGGQLYGIDSSANTNLYSINPATAVVTLIGAAGTSFNALTFNQSGVLYAAGTGTTDLYTLSTSSGIGTKVPGETTQAAYNSAGDLEFFNGTLYLTTQNGGNSILDSVNLATGALTQIGTNLGFTNVYGLAASGGILYGFTAVDGSSQVIRINTTTGAGTTVIAYGGTGRGGFGFNGTTEDAAPEPGTMGAMGLGLIALGLTAYRRRKG